MSDFALDSIPVKDFTDIFLYETRIYVSLEIGLIPKSYLVQTFGEYAKSLSPGEDVKEAMDACLTGEDVKEAVKETMDACLTRIPKEPFQCGEQAKNLVLKEALSKRATELGHIVTTNRSKSITDSSGFQPSRYSWSRPDLVIYHP